MSKFTYTKLKGLEDLGDTKYTLQNLSGYENIQSITKNQKSLGGKKRSETGGKEQLASFKTFEHQSKAGKIGGKKGGQKVGGLNRLLTYEQANEIRFRYKNEKISMQKLANEYNVGKHIIVGIITNKTYIKKGDQ